MTLKTSSFLISVGNTEVLKHAQISCIGKNQLKNVFIIKIEEDYNRMRIVNFMSKTISL